MEWLNGPRKIPFAIPMVRREIKYFSSYYYCCFIGIRRITYKSIHTVKYPDLSSALRLGPHTEVLPAPKLPE